MRRSLFRKFLKDSSGPTAVEYAFILALIVCLGNPVSRIISRYLNDEEVALGQKVEVIESEPFAVASPAGDTDLPPELIRKP